MKSDNDNDNVFLFALLNGEISILVAFATKIVNNIREVQRGGAIGGGGRQRALVPFDARGALVWVNVAAFLPPPFQIASRLDQQMPA